MVVEMVPESKHSPRIQRKREERRELIVHTAMELLIAGGLEQLTVQRLARALDYTPGALYRYFPSMEVLLAHMQGLAIASLHERIANALSELGEATSALDRLRAAARAYLQSIVDTPHVMSLVSQMLAAPQVLIGDHASRETVPRIIEVLQLIERLIAEAQKEALLGQGDARVRTVQLWALLQGAVQMHKLTRFDPALFSAIDIGARLVEDVFVGWGALPAGNEERRS